MQASSVEQVSPAQGLLARPFDSHTQVLDVQKSTDKTYMNDTSEAIKSIEALAEIAEASCGTSLRSFASTVDVFQRASMGRISSLFVFGVPYTC